jgi:multicomponent Na+:H+ antiporter subunit D
VKAALFGCVAIVQHRFGEIEERDLHGRARDLRPIGAVFALGAVMVASLPLTGSFLGRSLVEDAALKIHGYAWVPAFMAVITGILGGTLLRVAARVFWGAGKRAPRDPAGEPESEEGADREGGSSRLLYIPPVVMIAAAVAWGLVPGLRDAAGRAGAAFVDRAGYASSVLDGRTVAARAAELAPPGATAWLYAAGSLALAVAVAAVALTRVPALPAPLGRALDALREIHSGRPGDYVAWTVGGAAALGGVFAVTLL